ncbi:MAG TPA: hypothetical protein VFJ14_06790 [Nocardioidaceae bacterium]|nr:hypothetical protein [Nocardioidaceae bacterium]
MSPVERIVARVMAEHDYVPLDAFCWQCACGWTFGDEYEPDAHRAHVAEKVTAAIRADEGLVETVAEEVWAESASPGAAPTDAHRDARAALDAITGSDHA